MIEGYLIKRGQYTGQADAPKPYYSTVMTPNEFKNAYGVMPTEDKLFMVGLTHVVPASWYEELKAENARLKALSQP